jgi:xylose isomerase
VGVRNFEAINFLNEYVCGQGDNLKFVLEARPDEPRGDVYLATTGQVLAFIPTLDHSETEK